MPCRPLGCYAKTKREKQNATQQQLFLFHLIVYLGEYFLFEGENCLYIRIQCNKLYFGMQVLQAVIWAPGMRHSLLNRDGLF